MAKNRLDSVHLNVTQEDLQFALDKIEKLLPTTKTFNIYYISTIVQFLKLGDFFLTSFYFKNIPIFKKSKNSSLLLI